MVVFGADKTQPVSPKLDYLQLFNGVRGERHNGHFQRAIHYALVGQFGI